VQQKIDEARRDLLESQGWIIVVVKKRELYSDPGGVIARVVAALRERGARVPPLSDAWRPHFGR
jgi:very-short-patch-repair endonuclease